MLKIVACGVSDLANRSVQHVNLTGRDPVAIYSLRGAYFALDGLCTHAQTYLRESGIEEENVVCLLHRGLFDIKAGEPPEPLCVIVLRTHAASVEGRAVFTDGG